MVGKVKKYNKNMVGLVSWYVKNTGDRTNAGIAKYFTNNNQPVSRQTIITWRKKYQEFDEAIRFPNRDMDIAVDDLLQRNLIEPREDVVYGPNGEVKEKRVFSPNHQDANAASKAGYGGSGIVAEMDREAINQDYVESVLRRKFSGELSALEAMQLIEVRCNPPESLKLEVKIEMLNSKESSFTQSILTEEQRKEVDEFKKLLADKFDCD